MAGAFSAFSLFHETHAAEWDKAVQRIGDLSPEAAAMDEALSLIVFTGPDPGMLAYWLGVTNLHGKSGCGKQHHHHQSVCPECPNELEGWQAVLF